MRQHGARLVGKSSVMEKIDKIMSGKGGTEGLNVGIVETARYPAEKIQGRIQSGATPTVASVAFVNEFGTRDGKIPSRPFMRNSIKDMIESKAVSNAIKSSIDPLNPVWTDSAAQALAPLLVAIMRKAMKNPEFPPNAPFTKEQKTQGRGGNTTPLIDTGLLRNSIDAVLVKDAD